MNYVLYDFYSTITEIYLLLSITYLLIYGVFLSASANLGFPILNKNFGFLTLQILLLSFFLTQNSINLVSWNSFLILDDFSIGAKTIILLTVFIWVTLIIQYPMQAKINAFEFWILILLAVVAILLIIQSYDLLSIYLTIEFQSLIFYILASFKRTSEFSTEAGLKYFVLGAFSSALLLFGFSFLYGLTGLTNLNDFSNLFIGFVTTTENFPIEIVLCLLIILTALFFKISASPFHMWAPDVYEGASITVTAFFAAIPKLAIFSILFRFLFFSFCDFIEWWNSLVLFCALLSLVIGALGAFTQAKWKRFMAFSSIANVGFLLLALALGSTESIFSVVVYLIIYSITTLGIFGIIMSLQQYSHFKLYQSRYLSDLMMLATTNPILAVTASIFLFSTAGIPPLAGFFSKLFILLTAIKCNVIGTSIIVVIINCIACFYYIRLIKGMYFSKVKYWPVLAPLNKLASLILGISLTFLSWLCVDLELISLTSTLMLSI
uniref:NADH dehydrogenase subunit 2 n=1 Tax=Gelidiella flabella TaxID=2026927 RepID=A0A7G9IW83_9FLOR|nr:NADH dehydrogenase subunit 2 [Gelidiella flabella]QNM39627.1 NADH dehydrogenase subunit 2 [Gelidiella flabella]